MTKLASFHVATLQSNPVFCKVDRMMELDIVIPDSGLSRLFRISISKNDTAHSVANKISAFDGREVFVISNCESFVFNGVAVSAVVHLGGHALHN